MDDSDVPFYIHLFPKSQQQQQQPSFRSTKNTIFNQDFNILEKTIFCCTDIIESIPVFVSNVDYVVQKIKHTISSSFS